MKDWEFIAVGVVLAVMATQMEVMAVRQIALYIGSFSVGWGVGGYLFSQIL